MHTDQSIMTVKCNYFDSRAIGSAQGFQCEAQNMNKIVIRSLGRDFIKFTLLALGLFIITGCGIVYDTYSLSDDPSNNIRVIKLTPETVLEANSSPFKPQDWPEVFSSRIKDNKVYRNKVLSDPALDPKRLSGVIEWRLPTKAQPKPYKIGIGDVITLSTPMNEDLIGVLNGVLASQNRRQSYTVQDNGSISITDIGRVIIGGLTLEEAEDAIYRQFVDVGIAPSFSIEVAEFNSQKVSVTGNVISPGMISIALQPLYLDQAIYSKGGINTGDASYVIIRLYRKGSIYQMSGPELYNMNESNKILLEDGDRIVVDMTEEYENVLGLRQEARARLLGEIELETEAKANEAGSVLSRINYGSIPRQYIYIIGEVYKQSRFALPFESRAVLADALLESGGGLLSSSGNPKQIYVIRGARKLKDFTSIKALHLDASNAANFLLATHLELRPKDVIFVGSQPVTNWNRVINQIIPSLGLSDMNIPTIN